MTSTLKGYGSLVGLRGHTGMKWIKEDGGPIKAAGRAGGTDPVLIPSARLGLEGSGGCQQVEEVGRWSETTN